MTAVASAEIKQNPNVWDDSFCLLFHQAIFVGIGLTVSNPEPD